jgi:hypothetical protein
MTTPSVDRVWEIERLAALEPVSYEVVRIDEAKRLGIRPRILDQEVAKKRRALGLESGNEVLGQGRAVKISDLIPWHEPLDGDRVASALAAALKNYAVLPDVAADAIALWVLHTWTLSKFTISPRLPLRHRRRVAVRQLCCVS